MFKTRKTNFKIKFQKFFKNKIKFQNILKHGLDKFQIKKVSKKSIIYSNS